MNVIDAVKSGKFFKRKSEHNWREPIELQPGYNEIRFELSGLVADDWEVETTKVIITRAQFFMAVDSVLMGMDTRDGVLRKIMEGVAIALGLGDA